MWVETSGLAGVSDATLSRIENNLSSITVRTAKKIAAAMDAPLFADLYDQNILGLNIPAPEWITTDTEFLDKEIATPQDFGTFLHSARLEKGYSLKKLGKMSELSHVSLLKYEKGLTARMQLHFVVNIDNALDLDGRLIAVAWKIIEL